MKLSLHWAQRLLALTTLIGATGAFVLTPAHAAKPADKSNNGHGNGNDKDTSATVSATAYSGQATAVHIEGARDVGPIILADTGALATAGGSLDASVADVNIAGGGLTVANGDASADGSGPEATASASASKFHVEVAMWTGNIIIEGDFIGASVSASSNAGGHTDVNANVTIRNLTVNGAAVNVTGQANQVVTFPNDTKLIINEQFSDLTRGSADIQVTALHFWACDIEGRVGIVHSGITVNGTPPPPEEHTCGKLTGGGWITGTPGGGKGTFGISGGIRRGEFWGHLNYIDHDTGMHVSSTAVTGFDVDPTDANGRIIRYNVTIDGVAGTATVRVVDNGEPGRDDIFDITLSTGYHAAGDLGGARPGGGNIQLHKCPPGWE
jgi:hypothetical protein